MSVVPMLCVYLLDPVYCVPCGCLWLEKSRAGAMTTLDRDFAATAPSNGSVERNVVFISARHARTAKQDDFGGEVDSGGDRTIIIMYCIGLGTQRTREMGRW